MPVTGGTVVIRPGAERAVGGIAVEGPALCVGGFDIHTAIIVGPAVVPDAEHFVTGDAKVAPDADEITGFVCEDVWEGWRVGGGGQFLAGGEKGVCADASSGPDADFQPPCPTAERAR